SAILRVDRCSSSCYDARRSRIRPMEDVRMTLTITGRHMDLTEALKAYVENGLQKLKSHFDKITDVTVVLSVEKHRHECEINLHANGVRNQERDATGEITACVDACLAKSDTQSRKYRERIIRHQPRTAREVRAYHLEVTAPAGQEVSGDGNVQVPAPAHRVV